MLKHSRVTGIMDVGRLAEAVSMPGIDPRTWVSLAVVDAIGIDGEGMFADTTMVPGGVDLPCRVALQYAGPGFGESSPVALNDEVVVIIPDGNPAHGGIVVARLWSMSDAPPPDIAANPGDRVLVMKSGQSYRVGVSGGGQVVMGQTEATDAAVLGSTYRSAEDTMLSSLATLSTGISTFAGAMDTFIALILPIAGPSSAQVATATAACTAFGALGTALQVAIQSFQAQASAYLSNSVAVGK